MKKTKNYFATVIALLAVFIIGATSFSFVNVKKASAVSSAYNGEDIYYYYDFYPTLKDDALFDALSTYHNGDYSYYTYFYERGNVSDAASFDTLCNSNYFNTLSASIVVIDIKTFIPNAYTLYYLFSGLKANGCKTVFITTYADQEFNDNTFVQYVDLYYHSDFGRLRTFMRNSAIDLKGRYSNFYNYYPPILQNTCIVMEGYLLGITSYPLSVSAEQVCYTSLFFRLFIEEFGRDLGITGTYAEIITQLFQRHINIIVHVDGDVYVNLKNGQLRILTCYEDLMEYMGEVEEPLEYMCGITVSPLTNSDYNSLILDCQTDFMCPLYVFEIVPIPAGNLDIITDTDLEDAYGIPSDFSGEEDTIHYDEVTPFLADFCLLLETEQ